MNYKFIYYANLPFSYYSQFTVIIIFDNSDNSDNSGYITLSLWIWDLGSITPYGLSQDDGYYCQNKSFRKRKVRYRTMRLFILIFLVIFLLLLLFHNIQFNGVDYTSLLLCAI